MDIQSIFNTVMGPGGITFGAIAILGLLYQLYAQAQKNLLHSLDKRIDSLEAGQKECDTRYGLLLAHVLSLKTKE